MKHTLIFQLAVGGSLFVSLTLITLAYLATQNIDHLTSRWGRGLSAVIYLKAEVPAANAKKLARVLADNHEVTTARYVSPKEAMERLREGLGQRQTLLADVRDTNLPASIELSFKPQSENRSSAALISSIQSLPSVEEVDHLGPWAEKLESVRQAVNRAFWIVAFFIALVGSYFVRQSARLCLTARRNEIEVQRILGANDRFIILPFVIEGAIQGLFASLAAVSTSYVLFRHLANAAEASLATLLSYQTPLFLNPTQLAYGLAIGMAAGILANHFAVTSRLRIFARTGLESQA